MFGSLYFGQGWFGDTPLLSTVVIVPTTGEYTATWQTTDTYVATYQRTNTDVIELNAPDAYEAEWE